GEWQGPRRLSAQGRSGYDSNCTSDASRLPRRVWHSGEREQVTTASTLLSLCELFSDVDPAILSELVSELQVITLERGETLMRQGEAADCMYAIVSGRLHLFT